MKQDDALKALAPASPSPLARLPTHYRWVGIFIAVALGYLFGLGGDQIPGNGDELVYAHIARLTAQTGHWLPLVSSYDFMRNTKPPLLFWQALVAGQWGEHWTLFHLRVPSVLYSWGVSLMAGLLTWKILQANSSASPSAASAASQEPAQHAITLGAIAGIVYLTFFSSYRYGRPYLTSSPETFWLFAVFFVLAWSPSRMLASRWRFPLSAGLLTGIGCLYKTFAMVIPVGLALALCYQIVSARQPVWRIARPGVVADGLKVILCTLLALGIFSLWFVVDPQPGEVWREFVLGENAGKFKSAQGYLEVALRSSGGVTGILLGYFTNAGLLLPVAIGAAWAAWRSHRQQRPVSDAEKILWLWLLVVMVIFVLPNQRSARYLVIAMPAVAILIALHWQRIGRVWFMATLLICIIATLLMGLIGWGATRATHDAWLYSALFWLFLALLLGACLYGLFKPDATRHIAALAGFSVLFSLAWVTQPFEGRLGRFSAESLAKMQGQTVAVPHDFLGQFERYEFIIPGARVKPYLAEKPVSFGELDSLLASHRYVLVQRPVGEKPCEQCRIVDARWDLRTSKNRKEGNMAAFRSPETFWFAREYLVERATP